MKDKLFMKILLLVLIHGTCPKSRIPWRKIISASPDVFLGLQMFKVTTKLSHTHEPRSGRSLSLSHLPHPQCPWACTPGQSTLWGGNERAAVLFLLSFTIISVLPCLHHQKAKGVEERKKKELTISIFSCTLLGDQERLCNLTSQYHEVRWVGCANEERNAD